MRPVLVCALVCALGLALGGWAMLGVGPLADEGVHAPQVESLRAGSGEIQPRLTTLPTYHALVAALLRLTGTSGLTAARAANLALAVAMLLVFAGLCRRISSPRATAFRTVQLAFLPILFPFFFLVYTDTLSLLLVLLAVWLADRPHPVLAPLAALAAVLVRQDNILWVVFVALIHLRALYRNAEERRRPLPRRGEVLAHAAPYAALAIAFAVFVIANGGVSMSQAQLHPTGSFHAGNLYFFLFVALVCFLPLHEARAGRVLDLLRHRPWILLVLAPIPWLWGLQVDHPYNRLFLTFLRNLALDFFTHDRVALALFYLGCAAALLSLAVTRLKRPIAWTLAPLTAVALASHWLIEQRYTLIPLALWQVFREDAPGWAEWRQVVYGMVLTALIQVGIAKGMFFL